MSYQYHTVDVFTDKAFGGNQLAVLPDARGLSSEDMQAITREFNYSESTFVLPPDNPANTRRVRIFVPGKEIPFAGHPTVGTAFVLAACGEIPLTGDETKIVFEEGVGDIGVTIFAKNGKPVSAQLTTAIVPETREIRIDPSAIAETLSLDASDLKLSDGDAIEAWSCGLPYLCVPLRSRDALKRARCREDLWRKHLEGQWAAELYPFFAEPDAAAYHVRMFAPAVGVPEDPATGSAAAALAGYVAQRSPRETATVRFTVYQGVELGRPSRIDVEVDTSPKGVTAVRVAGSSVLVSSGTLHIR
jgi:trans-2,3-dihydro-3-hydroxyanthranilate isomerase